MTTCHAYRCCHKTQHTGQHRGTRADRGRRSSGLRPREQTGAAVATSRTAGCHAATPRGAVCLSMRDAAPPKQWEARRGDVPKPGRHNWGIAALRAMLGTLVRTYRSDTTSQELN